jgi:hypothetical protein
LCVSAADRENLFCVHWGVSDEGGHVLIVHCAIDLASHPHQSTPVRTNTFVVHEMRAIGEDTEWSICLEFNAGGSLPSKLVNSFLYGQSKTFAHLSKYVCPIHRDPAAAYWCTQL